jgi:hypothetical protein
MTCYTRHLKEVFDKAGIEFTKENKRQADKHFKQWLGKTNCSETWKELKTLLADSAKKEEVIKNLRAAFS